MGDGRPLRVGLVIQSLMLGAGTEEQIRMLRRHADPDRLELPVCLTGTEPPPDGIPAEVLGMGRTVSPAGLRGFARFRRWVRRRRLHGVLVFWRDAELVAAVSSPVPIAASRRNIGAGYLHTRLELMRTRVLNRRFRLWAANSQAAADYTARAEHVEPRRIRILPNLLDTGRFRPPGNEDREAVRAELGLPVEAPVLACVANLRPVKRHTLLLEAFRILQASVPDAVLLLLGDGPLRGALEREAPAGVVFLGRRRDPERVLHAADLVVLTSLVEGFPNALLEAAAVGLPVVTTAAGGAARELVEAAGHGVTAGERPEEVAAAITGALREPAAMRAERGRRGRRYVEATHAPERAMPRWEAFFRELARPRPGGEGGRGPAGRAGSREGG